MSSNNKATHVTDTSGEVAPRQLGRFAWLIAWLALGALLLSQANLGALWPAKESRGPSSPAMLVARSGGGAMERPTKPIQRVRVGDRVWTEANPTGERDLSLGSEIDPANWRSVSLRAPKADGSWADVVLLRPTWWIEANVADGVAEISVPECGIEGRAQVLFVGPCPAVSAGEGRVVTGTFKHHSAQTYNLYVTGVSTPIGTTANHPFWSEDAQAFVRADELKPGTQLRLVNGLARVQHVAPRSVAEPVYNLEVQIDHTYHVSEAGVLVHNGGLCLDGPSTNFVYQLVDKKGQTVYYGIADRMDNVTSRLRSHSGSKAGKFAGMQVIAKDLTRREALSLEAQLIGSARNAGRFLLNIQPRSIRAQDMITQSLFGRLITPNMTYLPR